MFCAAMVPSGPLARCFFTGWLRLSRSPWQPTRRRVVAGKPRVQRSLPRRTSGTADRPASAVAAAVSVRQAAASWNKTTAHEMLPA